MKSKEEIKQLAKEVHYASANQGLDANGCFNQYQGFIKGYTQCQEDMADKKYTEEDMRQVFEFGLMNNFNVIEINNDNFKYFINSLNKVD
jgi:hypothetical protein